MECIIWIRSDGRISKSYLSSRLTTPEARAAAIKKTRQGVETEHGTPVIMQIVDDTTLPDEALFNAWEWRDGHVRIDKDRAKRLGLQ